MAHCSRCGAEWGDELVYCPHDGTELEVGGDLTAADGDGRLPARVLIPEPGAVLGGKYRLELVIGKGGMGVVFKARHLRIDRDVAIKILRPEVVGDERHVSRFVTEARLAGSIGHDGIVEVLDLVTPDDGPPYIVMEHLEGEALRDRMRRGPVIEPVEATRIAVAVVEALGAAHRRGIVHRDVKPGNVFLARKEGRGHVVKLLDFGVARVLADDLGASAPGRAIGTAQYMPPEQITGGEVDQRADLYAASVVLFHMIAGSPPWPRASLAELATAKLTAPAPRLSDLCEVTFGLDEAVAHGLARNVEDRPGSADELARELRQALEQSRRARKGTPTDAPTVQIRRRARIAVLPFELLTGEPADAWLAEALPFAATEELMLRPGQRVVERRLVEAALAGAELAAETSPEAIGAQLGAGAVVTGRIKEAREDGQLQVDLFVVDVGSGQELGATRVQGGRDRIVGLVAGSLDALASFLELSPEEGESSGSLARRDAEAFRLYVELARRVTAARLDARGSEALLPEIDWALAVSPADPGLRRLRAEATLSSAAHGPTRPVLDQANDDLEALAASGYGGPWVPAARAAIRLTDEFFDPEEALVLASEATVLGGLDPRLQLVEATALECLGRFGQASRTLSDVLDHCRGCSEALLRLATLELSPARVAAESLERAAYLLRAAHRLGEEEAVEGPRASSARLGWPPMPALWPLDAIVAVRKGDSDGASAAVDGAALTRPADLFEKLYALSARDVVAVSLGLRPRWKPGLLLGAMDEVRSVLAGPRSHVVHELAICMPEAWIPVLAEYLERRAEDHRLRLLRAMLLQMDGDLDDARDEALRVAEQASSRTLTRLAMNLARAAGEN